MLSEMMIGESACRSKAQRPKPTPLVQGMPPAQLVRWGVQRPRGPRHPPACYGRGRERWRRRMIGSALSCGAGFCAAGSRGVEEALWTSRGLVVGGATEPVVANDAARAVRGGKKLANVPDQRG